MITLVNIMRANAASCILFGLIFLLIPTGVATFLSAETPISKIVLLILGIGLILNGIDLIRASYKPLPSKAQILYFSIGDFLWALTSVTLVLFNLWITTQKGMIATILIAIMVTAFGVLQILKRKDMAHD